MSNDNENRVDAAPDAETLGAPPAGEMSRRDAVQLLAALPFAAIVSWPTADQERARRFVDTALKSAADGVAYAPKFFTAAEFRTARILADMIIPHDERSGNASDAGVPEFMDFTMNDRPNNQKWMRDGLAWLDRQSNTRFGKSFVDATEAQRAQILDNIAWPARAPATMTEGVSFFNRFRDLTSSGFWSSQIGVKDLQYKGNVFVSEWNGCPPAALNKLGVNYDKFDPKNLRLTPG
ncbi:MAG TPA: gluconate 2-dehydrogenase subunit 3 family protein [Gemmatimonadaceae bacterium]|nr:gluconate 2-dehydrogenase subunit 3 family protein [Gemmatimonadaceae bacterium]